MQRLFKIFYLVIVFLLTIYSATPYTLASSQELVSNQKNDGQAQTETEANKENQETLVGPKEAVGPIEPTGNILPAGPMAPVGPVEMSGPVEPTGPEHNAPEILANTQTGPNSNNANSSQKDSTTKVTEANTAEVINTADIKLSSGKNNIESNTSIGGLQTGDIYGNMTLLNTTNSNLSGSSSVGAKSLDNVSNDLYLLPISDRYLLNSLTGPGSNNTNQLDSNNFISVYNDNSSTTANDLSIEADTGNNTILNNTEIGKIKTGGIKIALNTINLANLTGPEKTLYLDLFSILGNLDGDIIVPSGLISEKTGPNSNNVNSKTATKNKNTSVANQSSINNNVKLNAQTGDNSVSSNSKVGSVKTGKTSVKNSIINSTNSGIPILYVINLFGQWLNPQKDLPENVVVNQVTGPNSNNSNASNTENNIGLEINNSATVDNIVNIDANTGGNKIVKNTTVDSLETGSVNVYNNIINAVNSFSEQFDKFYIAVTNIFGNWSGSFKTDKQKAIETSKKEDIVVTHKEIEKTISTSSGSQTIPNNNTLAISKKAGFSPSSGSINTKNVQAKESDQVLKVGQKAETLTNSNIAIDTTQAVNKDQKNENKETLPLPVSLLIPALAMLGIWSVYEGVNYVKSKKK